MASAETFACAEASSPFLTADTASVMAVTIASSDSDTACST